MRNKRYSKEFIEWLRDYAKDHSINEIANETHIEKRRLVTLLWRNNIKHKDYNKNKIHINNALPVGSERTSSDGITRIKVEPNKWVCKQRYIYEKYYNIELPSEIMVIFLDGDKTNFDINNLRAVTTSVYNTIMNKHLVCDNIDIMNTALDMSELYNEIKDKKSVKIRTSEKYQSKKKKE